MKNRPSLSVVAAAVLVAALGCGVASAQQSDDYEPAQFRFERQLRVNPFDPAALNNLAVVKAGQGRYADAMDLLQRASRLAPDSVEVQKNLDRLRVWMETAGEKPPKVTGQGLDGRFPPEPPRLWDTKPP